MCGRNGSQRTSDCARYFCALTLTQYPKGTFSALMHEIPQYERDIAIYQATDGFVYEINHDQLVVVLEGTIQVAEHNKTSCCTIALKVLVFLTLLMPSAIGNFPAQSLE